MRTNTILPFLAVLAGLEAFSQNIGIGTSSPTRARLELHGGVGRTSAIFGGEGVGISLQKDFPTIGFNQYYDGVVSRYIGSGTAAALWYSPSTGILNLDGFPYGTANATGQPGRMLTIAPQGRLGIGTGTTNGYLQFPNSLFNRKIVLYEAANNDNQFYGFGIENSALRYQVDAPSAAHRFYAANSASGSTLLMTIGGNKKVKIGEQAAGFRLGINAFDPMYTLEVVETGNRGMVLINPNNGYHYWELRVDTYSTNVSDALTFYYDGSPTPKGWFRPTDGGYSSNSDRRLKRDIHSLQDIMPKILQLQPSVYQFLGDQSGQNCLGFIAQDVKTLFPELVDIRRGDPEAGIGDLHGINYAGFGVLAIKAIQEQQEIIDDLKTQVEELRKIIVGLKALDTR